MDLPTLWFVLICTLWLGYFFLEGFDFGVGILMGTVARDDSERRVVLNTIGPVWDGNEVWVIVATAGTFAAFPAWYATELSAAYLPVLVILLALIGRGVAFEYRGKVDSDRWRRCWDMVLRIGSWIPPLGWGLVLTGMATGLPIDGAGVLRGGPLALFTPPAVLGALAIVGFSIVHGAVFLSLKTEGEVRTRSHAVVLRIGPLCLLPMVALMALLQVRHESPLTLTVATLGLLAGVAAVARSRAGRDGQAFVLLGVLLAGMMALLFGSRFPAVVTSTIDGTFSLTVSNSSSSPYALSVITWLAAFGAPVVLAYQSWTYWVFRRRVGTRHIPPVHVP